MYKKSERITVAEFKTKDTLRIFRELKAGPTNSFYSIYSNAQKAAPWK